MKEYRFAVRVLVDGKPGSVKYDKVGNIGVTNSGALMIVNNEGDCIALHADRTWTTTTLKGVTDVEESKESTDE